MYFYANVSTNSFASYKISLGDVIHSNIIPAVDVTTDLNFTLANYDILKTSANLTDFTLTQNGSEYPFSLNYKYYESYYQDNEQASGAYIFRPANNNSLPYSEFISGRYFVGKNLVQIQVNYISTHIVN